MSLGLPQGSIMASPCWRTDPSNWGHYYDGTNFYSVTNRSAATAPPTSNVAAVAAGSSQDLALMSNGTVVAWGEINANGTEVPANLNLTNVAAIACGWGFNLALSSNGTITAWGANYQGYITQQMFPAI